MSGCKQRSVPKYSLAEERSPRYSPNEDNSRCYHVDENSSSPRCSPNKGKESRPLRYNSDVTNVRVSTKYKPLVDDSSKSLPHMIPSKQNLLHHTLLEKRFQFLSSRSESEIRSCNTKNFLEVAKMKSEMEKREQRLKRLMEENKGLNSRIEALCSQNEDLFNITLKQHNQYSQSNAALKQDISRLQSEMEELQKEIDKKEGELQMLNQHKASVAETEETFKALQDSIQDMLERKEFIEEEIKQYIGEQMDVVEKEKSVKQLQSIKKKKDTFFYGLGVGSFVFCSSLCFLYGAARLVRGS